MKRAFSLAVIMSLAGGTGLHAQGVGEVGLPIGSVAPGVEIETLDGEAVDIGQFVGNKPMILEFWATWCENCKALQPQMNAAHEEYGDQVEFLIIAVAVGQSKRAVRRHVDREHLPFDFLWDTRGRATRAYKAPTTSYVVVVDATGKVTYTGVGPDQDIDAAVHTGLGDAATH